MATLATLLQRSPSSEPAIILPGQPSSIIDYVCLEQHVVAFQAKLAGLGIGPQVVVTICLPNSYEFVIAFLAITRQQAIAAPLNPVSKEDEIVFHLRDTSSVAVLVPIGSYVSDSAAVRSARKYEVGIVECQSNAHEVICEVKAWGQLQAHRGHPLMSPFERDIALLLYTSGTTGKPKSVSQNLRMRP